MQILKKILTFILILESRLIIAKYKPFVITVTGSVGKTSTKDAIYTAIVGQGGYTRKSEKSMNSEIGLPLTIIGAPNAWKSLSGWLKNIYKGFILIIKKHKYPDCLILEIGADHPGDIKNVVKWLKPDISIITMIGSTPVHVEFFKNPEEVFQEKLALAYATNKGGKVILYADEQKVLSVKDLLKDKQVEIITYGKNSLADIKAENIDIVYQDSKPKALSFVTDIGGTKYNIISQNTIGESYIYPNLCALAVTKARNLNIAKAVQALNNHEVTKGRMHLISGINDSILVDDSYNSSPDAVLSAINSIKKVQVIGKKIFILGDMLELGKHSAEQHRLIGKEVVAVADMLVLVGNRSRSTGEEAIRNGFDPNKVLYFDSSSDVAPKISSMIGPNDIILIKGSQSIRMEKVTKALLKEPQKADTLLVRQEKEWLEK